jgi:hypothetical protein
LYSYSKFYVLIAETCKGHYMGILKHVN